LKYIAIAYVLLIMKGNMAKTKKISMYSPLVVTGYILFSLIVIETLISTTIPLGILLFNPGVLHFNVVVILIGLTVGAILPVLLGFIIGDHAIKNKNKLSHHFAGMSFGLLAYWIMTLMAVSIITTLPNEFLKDDYNARFILTSLLPGIGVALITAILSVAHMRSRHATQDVLMYKPFYVLLIASIAMLPVWSLTQNVMSNSLDVYSFVGLILIFASGIISYATLRKAKLSSREKIVWSAVSISILFICMYTFELLVSSVSNYILRTPTMEMMSLVSWLGFALALVGWSLYWFKQVKTLR